LDKIYFCQNGDVREVVINAEDHDELLQKYEVAEELSPETVILNGTLHPFSYLQNHFNN
jgi:hypothetical protein